jgi:hypothetical protein
MTDEIREPASEPPPTPEAPRRRALLICNGTFRDLGMPKLDGVRKDHDAMRRVLGDPEIGGFEVTALLDKPLLAVRKAIAALCRDSGADDALLIYYSGYSFCGDDGSLYLPVADSDKEYPDATAVDAEFILSRIRQSLCRRIVLLVDGCHSGAFFNNNRGIPDGLFAITACTADQMTVDTPHGGAFTQALVEGLLSPATDSDGDGRIDIDELHGFVAERIKSQGYESRPQKWVWNVPEPIHIASAQPRVFLSYCRKDVETAERLKAALESHGFSVWLDLEDIQSGDWKSRVTDGLNRARALVFLMTPDSLAASAVQKELRFALAKEVPIIPVQTEDLEPDKLPDWYRFEYDSIHRHTLEPSFPASGMRKLVDAIRSSRRRGKP